MSNHTVEDFAKIRQVNVMRIKEGKEQGQKVVGIYCTYCPQELILAAGAIPVGLCGTSEAPIALAEETLPRNLCPLIKSSYGFAAGDTCPFFHFSDLVIGETTCDGKKKMFELMQEIKPVYVMQLPHVHQNENSFNLWVEELRSLRTWLEKNLDTTITDEGLWKAIDEINQETAAAKAICDINQMNPPPISGLDLLTITWSRSFNSNKAEVIEMLKGLREEYINNTVTDNIGRPRVLLTGCPVGLGSEKVVRLIEEAGGSMVAMENCSGYKTLELQTERKQDDPIGALARKY